MLSAPWGVAVDASARVYVCDSHPSVKAVVVLGCEEGLLPLTTVMKDIEETPGAQAEMRDKLEKSGQRGGSIPVIDVRGQILVGFSPQSVDRALAKIKGGTVL